VTGLMVRRGLRAALATAVMLVALVAGLPGSAHAAVSRGEIQYFWSRVDGEVGKQVSTFAYCPANWSVISAGAGNASLTGLVVLEDGTGVLASGYLSNPGAPYMPVVLGCAPTADLSGVTNVAILVNDHRSPAGTPTTFSATVKCPGGSYAFAGGGYFVNQAGSLSDTATSFLTNAPTPDGHGWTFSATALRGKDKLNVRARCMPLAAAPYIAESEFRIPNGQVSAGGYAVCPFPLVPLSGGVQIPSGGGATVWTEPVDAANPNPRRWYGLGGGNPNATVRVWAVCF